MTIPKTVQMSEDTFVTKYRLQGPSIVNGTLEANFRMYIIGYNGGLLHANDPGITMCRHYSVGKFMPGTKIRWEPNVGSTAPGRLFYCWVDSPEKGFNIYTAYAQYLADPTPAHLNVLRGLTTTVGNLNSFPIWMEKEIPFPTDTRRKKFAVDNGPDLSSASTAINTLDRVCQKFFFYFMNTAGAAEPVSYGSMWFHDTVQLEGLNVAPS